VDATLKDFTTSVLVEVGRLETVTIDLDVFLIGALMILFSPLKP